MPFFLIIVCLVGFAWFYVWKRLVIPLSLSKGWNTFLAILLALTFTTQLATPFLLRRGYLSKFAYSLSFAYGLLGLLVILLFYTLLKDIIYFGWRAKTSHNPQRRLFMNRAFNLAAFSMASGSALWGTRTALKGPELKTVVVPVKNLHRDLDGLKIAQISDIHVGSLIHRENMEKIVETVNNLRPDLIMLTGDLADGDVGDLNSAVEPIKNLQGPLGKFYITGNHEYYWDVDRWTEHVQSLGFQYLYNEHRVLQVGKGRLLIGGVADYHCQRIRPDHESSPEKSLAGAPESDFKLLLAHQPKSCFKAFEAGYDLQLSGHTHNGQFFPNNLIIGLFHPYVKGLNLHKNKMWVYVNSGTGFWGPPQRLGIPGEITLLTLARN